MIFSFSLTLSLSEERQEEKQGRRDEERDEFAAVFNQCELGEIFFYLSKRQKSGNMLLAVGGQRASR